jgi:hypothetical protein
MHHSILIAFIQMATATVPTQSPATVATTPALQTIALEQSALKRAEPQKTYAQCDPRWRNRTIKSETLCEVGCTLFALRSAAEKSGQVYGPEEFLDLLKRHNVFDRNDNVIWGRIPQALPLEANRFGGAISEHDVDRHLALGRQVLLQVDNHHWVAAAEVKDGEILVDDSKDGQRVALYERYRGITGFATITRSA